MADCSENECRGEELGFPETEATFPSFAHGGNHPPERRNATWQDAHAALALSRGRATSWRTARVSRWRYAADDTGTREQHTMQRDKHGGQRAIAVQAEKLMRQWVLGMEIHERVEQEKAAALWAREVHPYVAVSRETGAGGARLSRMVADKLNWVCMDRELLDFMAETYHLPHGALEAVDESKWNWLREIFGYWFDKMGVPQTEYVAHLGQMVLLAARHANTVFVGRGVQFYLPRDKGLAIRLIAPLEVRIRQTMELRRVDHDQAKQYVVDTDEGRRDFVQRYFSHDVADPSLYDLVINLERLTLDDAAELVVGECGRRWGT